MQKILQLRRSAGTITYKELIDPEQDDLNTNDLDAQINISRLLEPTLYKLLSATIKQAKPLGYKYIWSTNHCIKIRKDNSSQIFDIYNTDDLKFP